MNDTDLTADVDDQLFWDPKLDNSAIAVSAHKGNITLRGTVGSFPEKREATKAAKRVFGVTSVDNELKVKLMTDGQPRPEHDRRAGRRRLRHSHRYGQLAVPARRGGARLLERVRRARRLRRGQAHEAGA
jgi:hypothetical protein